MTRNEAKNCVKERLEEYVQSITRRDEKAGRDKYVCPICHSGEKKDGAFYLFSKSNNGNKDHFKCFSCNVSGDIFDLIAKVKNISNFSEQLNFACNFFGIEIDNISQNAKNSPTIDFSRVNGETIPPKQEKLAVSRFFAPTDEFKKEAKLYIEKCSQNIDKTDYLRKRGFSSAILKKYSVGFDEKKKMIVIPYSQDKTYYLKRSILDKNFFKPKIEEAGLEPIYNVKALYESNEHCFITESPLDALSIIQSGGQAIALGGIGSEKLLSQFEAKRPECVLILSLDNDKRGIENTITLEKELNNRNFSFFKALYSYPLYEGSKKDANDLLVSNSELFKNDVDNNIKIAKLIKENLKRQNEVLQKYKSLEFKNLKA